MSSIPVKKRPLINVGKKIWQFVALMENDFGAVLTHDSGHDKKSNKKATTWIFTFPKHSGAQIAVPMNKVKLSLLMRSKALSGHDLDEGHDDILSVEETYTNPSGGVASSVLGHHATFLNPSASNPLLRVIPVEGKTKELLELYLGNRKEKSLITSSLADGLTTASLTSVPTRTFSEEDLKSQLERQSEIGMAGELAAVQDELKRLHDLKCPNPEKYVKRISIADVGRGYDIESMWPGHERCIEVKTTTRKGSDFFLTLNERRVLTELGDISWIYRVVLNEGGEAEIQMRLQNPMKRIAESCFKPVVWRVSVSDSQ